MKMVAAAKLRRAQEQAEAARPYAERMERVLASLAAAVAGRDGAPALLAGTGKDQVHLLVVMTSDRGLCGGFNSSIARGARRMARELKREGKTVKILCVGRKGRDQLRREFAQRHHRQPSRASASRRLQLRGRRCDRDAHPRTCSSAASSTSARSSTTGSSRR